LENHVLLIFLEYMSTDKNAEFKGHPLAEITLKKLFGLSLSLITEAWLTDDGSCVGCQKNVRDVGYLVEYLANNGDKICNILIYHCGQPECAQIAIETIVFIAHQAVPKGYKLTLSYAPPITESARLLGFKFTWVRAPSTALGDLTAGKRPLSVAEKMQDVLVRGNTVCIVCRQPVQNKTLFDVEHCLGKTTVQNKEKIVSSENKMPETAATPPVVSQHKGSARYHFFCCTRKSCQDVVVKFPLQFDAVMTFD
jgi:hypothetical protein